VVSLGHDHSVELQGVAQELRPVPVLQRELVLEQ
jgi:hypothetical protein